MIIPARNLLHTVSPQSFLSNTEAAGTTIFRIKNTEGFGSSWGIQIGETGDTQSEVLLLNGNPGGTIGTTTTASQYEHPADTPVYAIKYTQVVFDRSTTGTTGTATAIGTQTYQASKESTEFDDTTGATTYAYRARFRNPTLGSTSQSDWITPAGFSFYSLAKIRQRAKDKLWDSSFIKDDQTYDDWANEWKDKMSNAVIASNESYALGTVDVAFGTAGLGTITTEDFVSPRRVEITYNGANYYLSTKQTLIEFEPNEQFLSTHPYHNFVGDNVIQVKPIESGGTARITFYRFGTTMVNDTDVLPLPMRSFTDSFVDYVKLQAQYKDGKASQQDIENFETQHIGKFVTHIVPRDRTGNTYVSLVSPTSADDFL